MQVQPLFDNLINHPRTYEAFGPSDHPHRIATWHIEAEEINSKHFTHRVHIKWELKDQDLGEYYIDEEEEEYLQHKSCKKFVRGYVRALLKWLSKNKQEVVLELMFWPDLSCRHYMGACDIHIKI